MATSPNGYQMKLPKTLIWERVSMPMILRTLYFAIGFLFFVPAANALDAKEAFKGGQLSNIWGFCQNEFTQEAKQLLEKTRDAHASYPDAYKQGFDDVSSMPGYSETELAGLGSSEKNKLRKQFCNLEIGKRFPMWIITQ